MLSSVLNIGIFIVLVILFATNIGYLAYMFGVLVSFVSQVFNLLSYVGADCTTITNVSAILTGSLLLLLMIKIFKYLMPSN